MHLIEMAIDGNQVKIPFPSEWNELTQSELRYCISTQATEHSQAKIFCFLITTSSLRNKVILPKGWESRLNKEQAAMGALDCLEFLYESNRLTKSPFKKIKIGGVLLHGPDDDFKDLTVEQMELAHPALERFRNSNDVSFLYEFCSYLFRRGKGTVTESSAKAILPMIKKMQPDILLCMYTWFTGCLGVLPLYFSELYEPDEATAAPKEFDYTGFTKMIHGAAGGRNGLRPEIRKMKVMEFLFDLNLLAMEAKDLKRNTNEPQ